jgi:hypothetical protein
MPRQNDSAWEKFICEEQIALDGHSYDIQAKHLKRITDREPRLLAKVDAPEQLPKVFRSAGYSLLAITNGSYKIFKGNVFTVVPDCGVQSTFIPKTEFPLETLGRGSGESEYLDNAFNEGLISDFTKSGKLYLTIRGRERTKKFRFYISKNRVEILADGVQIEVDAGYEGANDIILVEGKIGNPKYFNIRQLYYPFRHFLQLIPTKNIRTVFFSYDLHKATYSLHEYGFKDPEVFDSIYHLKCCVYHLSEPRRYKVDELLDDSFSTINNIVPQADDLNKILELLKLINSGQNTVSEIADYFVFDERQSNYYGEAAEFLGLISRHRGVFELTERGYQFISVEPAEQQLFIAKLVINSWIFVELIKKSKRKGHFSDLDIENLITSIMTNRGSKRYTNSTIGRRIQTIHSWIKWISEEFKCFEIEQDTFVLK